MSYDYLPEIIRLVNDSWAYSIEHELKPKMEKTLCEGIKEGIYDLCSKGLISELTKEVKEKINTLKFTISEIERCQKDAEEYLLELEEKAKIDNNSDDTT